MESKSLKLMHTAVKEWNEISDSENKITKDELNQIRAFIIGRGETCTIDDIHKFICNDLY